MKITKEKRLKCIVSNMYIMHIYIYIDVHAHRGVQKSLILYFLFCTHMQTKSSITFSGIYRNIFLCGHKKKISQLTDCF